MAMNMPPKALSSLVISKHDSLVSRLWYACIHVAAWICLNVLQNNDGIPKQTGQGVSESLMSRFSSPEKGKVKIIQDDPLVSYFHGRSICGHRPSPHHHPCSGDHSSIEVGGCWNEREGQQGAVRSLLIFANPPYMGTLQHLYTYTPIYTFTQYTPLQLYGATSTFDTLHCNEVNSIALPGRRK